jgi:hypothetical protein
LKYGRKVLKALSTNLRINRTLNAYQAFSCARVLPPDHLLTWIDHLFRLFYRRTPFRDLPNLWPLGQYLGERTENELEMCGFGRFSARSPQEAISI